MKIHLTIISCIFLFVSCSSPSQPEKEVNNSTHQANWKTELEQSLKLFGHRNWIVVADAAYPQQSNPAIKTISIDATQLEAVDFVSQSIKIAPHVEANIFVDKELSFVPEKDAKGIEAYRAELNQILAGKNVKTMLHEDIIRELDASAKLFNVLIIKTEMALPYTSVFFQLECGYWNSEAEENLRKEIF